MSFPMLLQTCQQVTCRHNLLTDIEFDIGAVKAHTWKDLQGQAQIIKKSISKMLG